MNFPKNFLDHQPTLRYGTATCYSTFLLFEGGWGPLIHPHREAGWGPLTHPHREAGRGPLTHLHREAGRGPLTHPHREAGRGPLTHPHREGGRVPLIHPHCEGGRGPLIHTHCCYLHFSESRGNVQVDMTYRLGWYPPVQLENPFPKQLS